MSPGLSLSTTFFYVLYGPQILLFNNSYTDILVLSMSYDEGIA